MERLPMLPEQINREIDLSEDRLSDLLRDLLRPYNPSKTLSIVATARHHSKVCADLRATPIRKRYGWIDNVPYSPTGDAWRNEMDARTDAALDAIY